MSTSMSFNLLGQFEIVTRSGRPYFLSRSKVSQLLGLLLLQNGETVSADTMIQELWGEESPRSALTTLQTYIYHARKIFAGLAGGEAVLVTRPTGYVIQVPDERIDVALFGQHVRQARTLLEGGRPEQAAARLDQAFDLWRGPVLSGMKTGTVLAAHLTYIDELRYTATELHVEASKRLGRYREIIPRLRLMVAENPLNENFHAQLIQALHKCGRRAEALQAYRNLWRILDIELGVEPAPELQLLQHELLARRGVVHGRS